MMIIIISSIVLVPMKYSPGTTLIDSNIIRHRIILHLPFHDRLKTRIDRGHDGVTGLGPLDPVFRELLPGGIVEHVVDTGIAGQLESALGRDAASATLLCYLDALDDAVKLEPVRHGAQQALLASVALRLGL